MLKRFLLSRATVITLLLLMLGAVLLSYLIPQRFLLTAVELEAWRASHPLAVRFTDILGLDHLYTSPLFALLLLFFTASMALSTLEQWRAARRKAGSGLGAATFVPVAVAEEQAIVDLRRAGYAEVGGDGGERRFVRQSYGYWGNFLLHAGMLVVIVSSVLMLMTQKWGSVILLEGESFTPGAKWDSMELGLLARDFSLPRPVTLDRVTPEFWETDDLKQLTTRFTVSGGGKPPESHELKINQSRNLDGFRSFQSRQFGAGFFVEFFDERGDVRGEILHVAQPQKRDKASYINTRRAWSPYLFKLKYFADASRQRIQGDDPLLVIRLMEGERIVGEGELRIGGETDLGPYRARLVKVERWGGLIFVNSVGIEGVFAGFAVIVLGGVLAYCVSPREVRLRQSDSGLLVGCRAARFEEFYRDEFDSLLHGWRGASPITEEKA